MLLCYHVREKEEESIAVYAMATSVITLLLTTCESHVFEGKESILGAATWRGAVNETVALFPFLSPFLPSITPTNVRVSIEIE